MPELRAASRDRASHASKTARIACCRSRLMHCVTEVDAQIRHARDAPLGEVPAFRKILRVTSLPLPFAACSGGWP